MQKPHKAGTSQNSQPKTNGQSPALPVPTNASKQQSVGAMPPQLPNLNGKTLQGASTAAAPSRNGKTPVSSNWEALKQVIGANGEGAKKRAHDETEKALGGRVGSGRPKAIGTTTILTPILALDCEMVGVGPGGRRSTLARVCMVNNDGHVLLDTFIKPQETVTDLRTEVSGVRAEDLQNGADFDEVQQKVAELIKGRILVGHALHNDLGVLLLTHPQHLTRDTSHYRPLMRSATAKGKARPRALRRLAADELGLAIQEGEHSPADDARVALYLYHKHRKTWEAAIGAGKLSSLPIGYIGVTAGRQPPLLQAGGSGLSASAAVVTTVQQSQSMMVSRRGQDVSAGANGHKRKFGGHKGTKRMRLTSGSAVSVMRQGISNDPMADL